MKKTIITLTSILLLATFSACDNDKDNNDALPSIIYLSPDKDAHYLTGGTLEVASDIKAEAGINQIKIDIHYGEGHSHDSTTEHDDHDHDHEAPQNGWSESKIITSATNKISYSLSESFVIPTDIATGHYHVGILVTDKNNQETKEYRTIEIEKE